MFNFRKTWKVSALYLALDLIFAAESLTGEGDLFTLEAE